MYGATREMNQPLVSSASQSGYSVRDDYEELLKGGVPCPTCRGSGRVPKDHPLMASQDPSQEIETSENSQVLKQKIDKQIFSKIRTELRDMKINQETFAAVSIGRTQGFLSDLLRRGEAGSTLDGMAVVQNILKIQAFFDKPEEERRQIYHEYKLESKDERRIRRQYFDVHEVYKPSSKRRRVINAHAKATMMKFFKEISRDPDDVAVQSMSDILNLDTDLIARFFARERKSGDENVTVSMPQETSTTETPSVANETEDDLSIPPSLPCPQVEDDSGDIHEQSEDVVISELDVQETEKT